MLNPESMPQPSWHLVSSVVNDLTPEAVKKYRDMEASPTERDISDSRIKHLRQKADAGRLVTFHWVTAKIGDKIIRVNGQHSSRMLSDMDGLMPKGLKVLQEHYEVEDGDALALLFQQFDDRKSGRSVNDIAGVYQGLQPALANIEKPIAKLAIDGYTWFLRYVEKVPVVLGDMSYQAFNKTELHPFIEWFASLHNSKTRELQNKPTTAAIYGSYIANETVAKSFWEEVSRGGDPDQPELPQTALDVWLRSIYEGTADFEDFGPGNYFQGCVYAWNAARENKLVTTIRFEVKKNFATIRE
jgi:hypothetical protein